MANPSLRNIRKGDSHLQKRTTRLEEITPAFYLHMIAATLGASPFTFLSRLVVARNNSTFVWASSSGR